MNSTRSPSTVGLGLSRGAMRVLRERGIFVQSSVSLECQHLAKRYVVHGLESGGAAGDVGHYVTFAREDGQPTECFCPVETIGVNGPHAVVLAPVLVRIEMLRKASTYELLITQHRPGPLSNGTRPLLEAKILFRGVHGRLELDLSGKDKTRAGTILPVFCSLGGEEVGIPRRFRSAVRAITAAVNCTGCSHRHYTRVPHKEQEGNAPSSVSAKSLKAAGTD
jgi:hypothetical protein